MGRMDRLKFVKYPPAEPGSQGVGPHKDSSGMFTFLTQDNVGGLQVLNRSGQWIDAPPIEGTFVVNIAQGFEAITGGRCPATSHRVIVSFFVSSSFVRCVADAIDVVAHENHEIQCAVLPGGQIGSHSRPTQRIGRRYRASDTWLGGGEEGHP